jgi:hypothetical protein
VNNASAGGVVTMCQTQARVIDERPRGLPTSIAPSSNADEHSALPIVRSVLSVDLSDRRRVRPGIMLRCC